TASPSSCMSRNSMLPDRSSASIMSRPVTAGGRLSPSNCGRAAAHSSSNHTTTKGHLRPALAGWPASGCKACSRSMKPTCRAAERLCAGGSQRRYNQGSGSSRKHSGQWNSNIMVTHPAAQFADQCLALGGAEFDLRPIQIGGQGLQGLTLRLGVALTQVIEPRLTEQS